MPLSGKKTYSDNKLEMCCCYKGLRGMMKFKNNLSVVFSALQPMSSERMCFTACALKTLATRPTGLTD